MDQLARFDPLVATWFRSALGEPGEVQARTWEAAAQGGHVLATAPTGSGKTLAAFLTALDSLIVGAYPVAALSVLYLSPLKALNTDIRRNLLTPLAAIRDSFRAEGRAFPDLRVETRSGDTSAKDRRRFLTDPPEILATTPESLALILCSPRARALLSTVRLVVLDEIHALAPDKRGVYLMAQLERLAEIAGEFQRIALSATVADIPGIAAYAAGCTANGTPRPITVVRSSMEKRYRVSVRYPPMPPRVVEPADREPETRWPVLIEAFTEAAYRNRTTLIFVNSRRHAEKIAFLMNEHAGEEIAWAHHGSLSREVRSAVEERLKAGLLRAVVATASLELGIDIGSVDEVVLAGTPGGAASLLQRTGRAGHRIGLESHSILYPMHPFDLLIALTVSADAAAGRLDTERRPAAPLDVLAQVILQMTAMDPWRDDDLFRVIRRAEPFSTLAREDFDLTVNMLRGRYDDGRLESLASRLERSDEPGRLRSKDSVLPLLYRSGGVIPDRGSYALVLAENHAPLGELDEEFVWERRVGDSFAMGTRAWRIIAIDDRAVAVKPSERGIQIVPFWRAESLWRSSSSLESALELLDQVADMDEGAIAEYLAARYDCDEEGVRKAARFVELQRRTAGLPGRKRIVCERFSGPNGEGRYAFLHTLRGGRTNAALGIALRTVADRRYGGGTMEFFWDDAGILIAFPALDEGTRRYGEQLIVTELFADLAARGFADNLAESLESSGLFGAAFRENAGRSLLLPKAFFGKRTPLWMTRLRAKRLYESVRNFRDFPIVKETWRTCLRDILDLESSAALVKSVAAGAISIEHRESTVPSPFARGSVWIAADSFMYRRDDGSRPSATDDELIREYLATDAEPPEVEEAAIAALCSRVKRLDPDYLPKDADDVLDWLDERKIIPDDEWTALRDRFGDRPVGDVNDNGGDRQSFPADERFATFRVDGAGIDLILSPDVREGEVESVELIAHWLRYEGPVTEERVRSLFAEAGDEAIGRLLADGALLRLTIVENEGKRRTALCDAEFASRLVRISRSLRRSQEFPLLSPGELQFAAALAQGIVGSGGEATESPTVYADGESGVQALQEALEPLLGVSAPVELWEREIFAARTAYRAFHLALLMERSPLEWYGNGPGRVGFALAGELRFSDRASEASTLSPPGSRLLEVYARASAVGLELKDAAEQAALPLTEAARALRELVWGGFVNARTFNDLARLEADASERGPESSSAPAVPGAADRVPFGARRSRSSFPPRSRWEKDRSSGVQWRALPAESGDVDRLETESALREKARRLLGRYGLLSRSIAVLDEGNPPWRDLFRVLRLMEFSGEVVGGRFAAGLEELQFRFAADDRSGTGEASGAVYCLCAKDPASLCGLPPLAAAFPLPSRLASNHLVWRGAALLLVSRRNGRDLEFQLAAEDTATAAALDCLRRHLRDRAVAPVEPLVVESINGAPARHSPYAALLSARGFVESVKGMQYVGSVGVGR